MIEPRTLKGFRDFLPQEARKRQYVIDTLKEVFSSYGFEPLETPALEYQDVLTGKYGEEGDKLMYKFKDNGDRDVALRYDQTVPLARVVAQYRNELSFPFKRFQIQPVWRAENTQKGRFREFLQCDIDSVGTTSTLADAEIIAVVATSLKKLGFTGFKILLNDRAVFAGLPQKAITIIDKLKKIGAEQVKEELKTINVAETALDDLLNQQPTGMLQAIMQKAQDLGVGAEIMQFAPTLARGLDYYTGIIIEVEIDGYTAGSVAGGGRYDNLIGMFTNTQIPAVGLAFGFDRILDAMGTLQLFPTDLTTSKVLVTIFSEDTTRNALQTASLLRDNGIATELYIDTTAKMEKQLKYADQKGIPYVIITGPDEMEKNTVILKNMQSREQQEMKIEELIKYLK